MNGPEFDTDGDGVQEIAALRLPLKDMRLEMGTQKKPYINYHFRHDIFFSYAYGLAGREEVKRSKFWSERLRKELISEILDLKPEFDGLDIFIDNQLDLTEPLSESIRTEVKSSGQR